LGRGSVEIVVTVFLVQKGFPSLISSDLRITMSAMV